jgi:hypothetical protein
VLKNSLAHTVKYSIKIMMFFGGKQKPTTNLLVGVNDTSQSVAQRKTKVGMYVRCVLASLVTMTKSKSDAAPHADQFNYLMQQECFQIAGLL